ncbi:MAG: sigma-70 family RNA polymerase sigma factor [Burkholderiales bacterium]|uniref:ECF-type sigma factor n=1 Tax=Candidatus Aalborgicola defluviihabitans TaxID=3386187 RepID=UPI001D3B2090|nr:sigma-70 family RNA polymerase sigma factor [Burkholderiales bacterium]MBK6567582.1 sigma-70 family RNA polymerase sigma factor [Burkholderiales bacterium]
MTPTDSAEQIAQLLQDIRTGDESAAARLYALLYPEIKRLARSRLYAVGGVTSLNTTGLVNEGFLRMVERVGMAGESRAQFFAYVGKVLRSVVLDHLRASQAEKRGGDLVQVTLSQAESIAADGRDNWFLLDSALEQLRTLDHALYELVELRYFAGLTVADIAKLLGVSTRTVDRDWVKAKTWLEGLIEVAD